jgi:hypothetical protein
MTQTMSFKAILKGTERMMKDQGIKFLDYLEDYLFDRLELAKDHGEVLNLDLTLVSDYVAFLTENCEMDIKAVVKA